MKDAFGITPRRREGEIANNIARELNIGLKRDRRQTAASGKVSRIS